MRTWMFLQNPFTHATDYSFLNAMGISTYHDNALSKAKSDPFILTLYNLFHPLHLAYHTAYNTWVTEGGTQQGETLNLQQLIQWLGNTKIHQWDIKIQNHYEQNTPAYKRLLPNRRRSFQQGKQIERIQAVLALSNAIGTDELLTAVKTDIDSCYALLDAAYNNQKGNQSVAKTKSADLEKTRIAMCIGQYANLGAMMQKYAATPDVIGQYFDLQAIRSSQQVLFTGQVKAGEAYTILKHTFGKNDEVKITNTGHTTLKFYLANTKGMQPSVTCITTGTGEQTILASALGRLTDTYLTVFNNDTLLAGAFEVELV